MGCICVLHSLSKYHHSIRALTLTLLQQFFDDGKTKKRKEFYTLLCVVFIFVLITSSLSQNKKNVGFTQLYVSTALSTSATPHHYTDHHTDSLFVFILFLFRFIFHTFPFKNNHIFSIVGGFDATSELSFIFIEQLSPLSHFPSSLNIISK